MSQMPPSEFQSGSSGISPPVVREMEDWVEPPKWPTVVGTISIVLASLGLLFGLCGGVGIAMLNSSMMKGPDGKGIPDVMKPTGAMLALMAVGTLMSIVMLVAGIQCVRRQYSTRLLHLINAVSGFILAPFGLFLQLHQISEIKKYMETDPNNPFLQGYKTPWVLVGPLIGFALGMAWPLFTAFWFGVLKRRPEDLTGVPTKD